MKQENDPALKVETKRKHGREQQAENDLPERELAKAATLQLDSSKSPAGYPPDAYVRLLPHHRWL